MDNIERGMPRNLSEEEKLDKAVETGNPFYGMDSKEEPIEEPNDILDMTDEAQEDTTLREKLKESQMITKGMQKNNPFYGMEGNEGYEEKPGEEPKEKAA